MTPEEKKADEDATKEVNEMFGKMCTVSAKKVFPIYLNQYALATALDPLKLGFDLAHPTNSTHLQEIAKCIFFAGVFAHKKNPDEFTFTWEDYDKYIQKLMPKKQNNNNSITG